MSSQNIVPKICPTGRYQDYSRGRALSLKNKAGIAGIGTMCLEKNETNFFSLGRKDYVLNEEASSSL